MIDDDRRLCVECARYRFGTCTTAAGVWANYTVPCELRDMPLRCAGFAPLPADVDQRPAAVRWPGIANDSKPDPGVSAATDRVRNAGLRRMPTKRRSTVRSTDGFYFD